MLASLQFYRSRKSDQSNLALDLMRYVIVSHPGFDAVLVPWLSGPEKETVSHGTSPEVFR